MKLHLFQFMLNCFSAYKHKFAIKWYQDNCRIYLDEYETPKEYYLYLVDDDPYFTNRWLRRQ
jgi:hypothetical protein